MDAGLIGGIVGGVIGILGGLVGTYFSIKNTAGPRERHFMIQVAIVAWIAVSAFVAGPRLRPRAYQFFLLVSFSIALPPGAVWWNWCASLDSCGERADPPAGNV